MRGAGKTSAVGHKREQKKRQPREKDQKSSAGEHARAEIKRRVSPVRHRREAVLGKKQGGCRKKATTRNHPPVRHQYRCAGQGCELNPRQVQAWSGVGRGG